MSELVQAVLPDGTVLWVRADDEESGPVDTSLRESAVRRLEDLPETLQTITRSVRSGLHNSAPDEFSIEFGIEIVGKSGRLVSALTEVGGKATLKVNVTWRRNDGHDGNTEPRTTVTRADAPEPEDPADPADPADPTGSTGSAGSAAGESSVSVPRPSAEPEAEPV